MVDSIKLLDITEQNAEEIAEHWAKEVHKNKRTTHYRNIKKEKLVVYAVDFYRNLRKLLVPEDRLEYTREYFQKYAKKCHEIGLPLQEAIYGLVLMRRHMWLYADFQAIFIDALEHNQAIDSIMRIMLMMDYAVYEITQYYLEIAKH
ncbi:MAG TPA: hypothetical protein PK842_04940 [Smithella sp.]|jgi:hypothetical protein|nr:hypothetical protein [Smithella sp.]HOE33534.1 hypothetical protein [Smithella sp.]HOG10014.1 hypothetical protein [Smithella sp.]HOO34514.1 hypothetical protein [Smithella sp.]HOS14435.1 hypothetical protein [Smithella sp.]